MFCPSFRNFDVAESGSCLGDWLVLTPTWNGESRLCGSVLPRPFISTRGLVWLYFHSQANSSGQAQGFRLSYIRGKLDKLLRVSIVQLYILNESKFQNM